MDISPIIISLKTAAISMILTFLLGLLIAKFVVNIKFEKVKIILDGILTLPLVLPPTVIGFFLLMIFNQNLIQKNLKITCLIFRGFLVVFFFLVLLF